MNLKYASDEEVRYAISADPKIKAILPIGSLEQHGKHLPLATDTTIAEYIASRVGERINALVLPPINYGISYEHKPLFNISISRESLTRVIEDICSSLIYNGVKRIIILNAHYGNEHAILSCIKEISLMHPNIMLASIPYWVFIDGIDHAGMKETSLMFAIDSNMVKTDKIKMGKDIRLESDHDGGNGYNANANAKVSMVVLDNITLLAESISRLTDDGIIGDPSRASKHAGEEMLNLIIDSIVDAINAIESMYERYLNRKS
jgi:creatinine amidohydrolase